MPSATLEQLNEVIKEAIELPADERHDFLARRCGQDSALLREAGSLVAAHETSVWTWTGADEVETDEHPVVRKIETGMRLGSYVLGDKLGEGGMGVVYRARRDDLPRDVAIKILKHGSHGRESLLRFAEEQQTLAMMKHPAIAAVFDAGSLDNGLPFFVMQLVSGVAITDYCDRHGLAIAERLELFARLCDGVEHAHSKTVVHRDLKPSNVMVSGPPEAPEVKIIDFGLSKALEKESRAFETRHGRILGTPAYMSPEQLLAQKVDVRSDLYSLGVILYEMLVGLLPIDPTVPGERQFAGVLRLVGGKGLIAPSERLANAPDRRACAAKRGCSAASLRRRLRSGLDGIALKAVANRPEDRYASAGELADAVRDFLKEEASSRGRKLWVRAKGLFDPTARP